MVQNEISPEGFYLSVVKGTQDLTINEFVLGVKSSLKNFINDKETVAAFNYLDLDKKGYLRKLYFI